jgi:uncharacterized protein YqeY
MLIEAIRARTAQAVKEKDEVARDVLRLALGEVQTAEARNSRALSEDEVIAIVRKLVKADEETLALAEDGPRATALRREIAILSELLPKPLSIDAIAELLKAQLDAIRAAKNDGQATGIAVKHLKSLSAVFESADVATAVKRLRA